MVKGSSSSSGGGAGGGKPGGAGGEKKSWMDRMMEKYPNKDWHVTREGYTKRENGVVVKEHTWGEKMNPGVRLDSNPHHLPQTTVEPCPDAAPDRSVPDPHGIPDTDKEWERVFTQHGENGNVAESTPTSCQTNANLIMSCASDTRIHPLSEPTGADAKKWVADDKNGMRKYIRETLSEKGSVVYMNHHYRTGTGGDHHYVLSGHGNEMVQVTHAYQNKHNVRNEPPMPLKDFVRDMRKINGATPASAAEKAAAYKNIFGNDKNNKDWSNGGHIVMKCYGSGNNASVPLVGRKDHTPAPGMGPAPGMPATKPVPSLDHTPNLTFPAASPSPKPHRGTGRGTDRGTGRGTGRGTDRGTAPEPEPEPEVLDLVEELAKK
eukprot:Hpha_TRINITY_DN15443_c2_g6::TRINITY_DN15443_c2_g6_i2::g.173978::m.173978